MAVDFLNSAYGNFSSNKFELPQSQYLSSFQQGMQDTSSLLNSGQDILNPVMNTQGNSPFSGFFTNDKGGMGWGAPAIGAATGIAQTFLGFKQLSEGKKQNRIAQSQWQQQFDIQKTEYDRRVSQRAERIANNNAVKQRTGG
jgi:hypothetical protein